MKGRSHDVKNLFIVDGSILVTCGGVNPTSTIQALALYIADSIKKRLATCSTDQEAGSDSTPWSRPNVRCWYSADINPCAYPLVPNLAYYALTSSL